ncbi:hypothetical protein [Polymorphobacter sp.]|uniref:hypothetical protein n=1 Tax=Polymorphobacter sp. TaxID=1909290 RepID=UPI003F703261
MGRFTPEGTLTVVCACATTEVLRLKKEKPLFVAVLIFNAEIRRQMLPSADKRLFVAKSRFLACGRTPQMREGGQNCMAVFPFGDK